MRIEICGGIGAGKTTLCQVINDNFLKGVFENFKINPFWQPFYANPDKYNFETEITFLLQHYHDIKVANETQNSFVCDFSFYQDLAYAVMGLKENRLKIFENVMNECIKEVNQPTLLIYLECDEFTLLNRIKNRARNEETTITTDFLHFLNSHISTVVNAERKELHILTINSNKVNFANNEQGKIQTISLIKDEINRINNLK
jgi:deoxyguanosine kinase